MQWEWNVVLYIVFTSIQDVYKRQAESSEATNRDIMSAKEKNAAAKQTYSCLLYTSILFKIIKNIPIFKNIFSPTFSDKIHNCLMILFKHYKWTSLFRWGGYISQEQNAFIS